MTIPAGKTMSIRGSKGEFTLDADMLAVSFGWSPEELRALMRRGLVASQVERGEGDDLGKWRLSVRCGNRRWRAIVLPDGTVTDQHIDFVTLASPSPSRQRNE